VKLNSDASFGLLKPEIWAALIAGIAGLLTGVLSLYSSRSQARRESRAAHEKVWQNDREQERGDRRAQIQRTAAGDAAREEAPRSYVTQMSNLMLDRELLGSRRGSNLRA
jgi:hypothetical protein